MELTKNDIKCLKSADRICFDYTSSDPVSVAYTSQIRAIKKTGDEWDTEKTAYIQVESTFSFSPKDYEKLVCFYMLHSPQVNNEWKTIAKLLRAGDTIRLIWGKGYGDTDLLRNAPTPISIDHLYLEIMRENRHKAYDLKYSFLVGTQQTKDDRLVAMIRGEA